jgi:hypothetical protein
MASPKTVAKTTTLSTKGPTGHHGRCRRSCLVVSGGGARYGAVGVDMDLICQCLGELGGRGLKGVLKSSSGHVLKSCCRIGRWAIVRPKSGNACLHVLLLSPGIRSCHFYNAIVSRVLMPSTDWSLRFLALLLAALYRLQHLMDELWSDIIQMSYLWSTALTSDSTARLLCNKVTLTNYYYVSPKQHTRKIFLVFISLSLPGATSQIRKLTRPGRQRPSQ